MQAAGAPVSEIKGVWLLTAKRMVIDRQGAAAWEALTASAPPHHRAALAEPLATEWYPEEVFGVMLQLLENHVAKGDPVAFATFLEEGITVGINRFFRSILGLATPAFVLRRLPALWKLVRRGAGEVTVDAGDVEATVRYHEFPHWGDARYRLLTTCSVRALLKMCTGQEPTISEQSFTRDTFVMRVVYRGERN